MSKLRLRGWDFGLFVELYELLSPFFDTELYTQWESPFPTSDKKVIGQGLKDIAKLWDFETDIDKVDLFTFFDFYKGALQDDLRSRGKAVFGPGKAGEKYEVDRIFFKKELKRLGLPVIPCDICTGTDMLKEYLTDLKAGDSRVIKCSAFRGDVETEKLVDRESTLRWLAKVTHDLGEQCDETIFICEHKVKDFACEPGRDDIFGGGMFATWGMVGWEKKGDALIGKMYRREKIPPILKKIDDALVADFAKIGYQGLYCMETIIDKKGKAWPLDICTRAGSPSCEGLFRNIGNLPEVIKAVANGKVADIDPLHKYVFIQKFHSSWLKDNVDLPVTYSKELYPWISIRNKRIKKNGQVYSISQDKGDNAGAVIALADTIKAGRDLVMERIEQVKCAQMDYSKTAFDEIEAYIREGEKWGINFS